MYCELRSLFLPATPNVHNSSLAADATLGCWGGGHASNTPGQRQTAPTTTFAAAATRSLRQWSTLGTWHGTRVESIGGGAAAEAHLNIKEMCQYLPIVNTRIFNM